mmetsp:Transcript_34005/g.82249  ORF Transcript_34005/g.82249 Transcript_34005/m.82249 type:complete len:229 (+) Transcript_34005:113-799(+)
MLERILLQHHGQQSLRVEHRKEPATVRFVVAIARPRRSPDRQTATVAVVVNPSVDLSLRRASSPPPLHTGLLLIDVGLAARRGHCKGSWMPACVQRSSGRWCPAEHHSLVEMRWHGPKIAGSKSSRWTLTGARWIRCWASFQLRAMPMPASIFCIGVSINRTRVFGLGLSSATCDFFHISTLAVKQLPDGARPSGSIEGRVGALRRARGPGGGPLGPGFRAIEPEVRQ